MAEVETDEDGYTELVDVQADQVDMVGAAANGTPWFFAKSDGGAALFAPEFVRELIGKPEPTQETVTMTGTPAALADTFAQMHEAAVRKAKYNTDDRKRMAGNGQAMDDGAYPIADEEDLDNAIHAVGRGSGGHDAIRRHIISRAKSLGASSKIPDNWNGDGSLKSGVSKAGGEPDDSSALDTTTVLAEPESGADGNPETPGSPAWEAIDAATARKWTGVAVRLRNALNVMANREMAEGAVADPDDLFAAADLEDARCALDYVIDTLAGFAVDEQAEADLGSEAAMDVIGKALAAFDPGHLDTVEGFAPILKAGRVLSAANEKALRDAATAIQQVLSRLPAPESDDGEPVAKRQETAVSATATIEPVETAPTATDVEPGAPASVAKADAQVAVYDANGRLVGVVDEGAITAVVQPQSPDDGGGMDEVEEAAAPDAAVIPGTNTVASPPLGDDDEMTKAAQPSELATLTEAVNALAQQVSQRDDLAGVVKSLQERVEHLAKMPDDRKSPLFNGATGDAGVASRDGSTEDPHADLRKSVEEATTPAAKRDALANLAYAEIRDRFARP